MITKRSCEDIHFNSVIYKYTEIRMLTTMHHQCE